MMREIGICVNASLSVHSIMHYVLVRMFCMCVDRLTIFGVSVHAFVFMFMHVCNGVCVCALHAYNTSFA